jgi:acetyltransferase-like isoleucine patch superfamily enzyme
MPIYIHACDLGDPESGEADTHDPTRSESLTMKSTSTKNPSYVDDPINILGRTADKLYSLWLRYSYPFAGCGSRVSFQFTCLMSRHLSQHMSFGSDVIIRKDTWLNIVEDNSNNVKLVIGDNSAIGFRSTLSAKNLIEIGRDVIVGSSVLIQDHHHCHDDIYTPIRAQGVTPGGRIHIGEGCWIGNGASIVCNEGELTIGRNCVIGTNALVTKSVPSYSVVLGNPARIAKHYDLAKKEWVLGGARADEMQLPTDLSTRPRPEIVGTSTTV